MTRRKMAAAACAFFCLGILACAPRQALRIPSPPAEVRKDAAPVRVGEKPDRAPVQAAPMGAAAQPPPPDYGKRYEEAMARTKEAIARGKTTDAIPFWKALEESPWRADAIYHEGVLLHFAGQLDEAADRYRRALSVSPRFEPAAANLLGIHILRGEKEKMRMLADTIFPPGTDPSHDMLPELQANLGAALLETGRRDEASLLFLALSARGMGTPALSWNMAVRAYRDGNRETARNLSGNLPADIANLYPVAASRVAWASETEELPVLDNPPEGQPHLTILSRNIAAFSAYRKGDRKGAEEILLPLAAGGDGAAEVHSNLGLLQMEMGNWKEARANLEKAVKANPSMPEGWLNLGIFREVYEGNAHAARECYETYGKITIYRKKEVDAWIGWLRGP